MSNTNTTTEIALRIRAALYTPRPTCRVEAPAPERQGVAMNAQYRLNCGPDSYHNGLRVEYIRCRDDMALVRNLETGALWWVNVAWLAPVNPAKP